MITFLINLTLISFYLLHFSMSWVSIHSFNMILLTLHFNVWLSHIQGGLEIKLWYMSSVPLSPNVFEAFYIFLRISYRWVEAYEMIEHTWENRKFWEWEQEIVSKEVSLRKGDQGPLIYKS